MYYGKHPFGKYALWFIAMLVGGIIIFYVFMYISFWLAATGIYQSNVFFQIVGWAGFLAIPLWVMFCGFKMMKAYQQANPQLIASQTRTLQSLGTGTKYCLNCGASIPSVSTYCPNCGAQQVPPPP